MIPCRSFRMESNGFMTIFAFERLVVHDESHTLLLGVIVKMICKFREEAYEFRFVEWMFPHEILQ